MKIPLIVIILAIQICVINSIVLIPVAHAQTIPDGGGNPNTNATPSGDGCQYVGQCVDNLKCTVKYEEVYTTIIQPVIKKDPTQTCSEFIFADDCKEIGECIDNYKCIVIYPEENDPSTPQVLGQPILKRSATPICNSSPVGGVDLPQGLKMFNDAAGDASNTASGEGIGIIIFASHLLRVFAIIAGMWAMFNFFVAGYMYITGMSDTGVTEKVKEKITMTAIGLAIIAGSYILAGLIGIMMFGDPTFIISPRLRGVYTLGPGSTP